MELWEGKRRGVVVAERDGGGGRGRDVSWETDCEAFFALVLPESQQHPQEAPKRPRQVL